MKYRLDDYLYAQKFNKICDFMVCRMRIPYSLFFKHGWYKLIILYRGDLSVPSVFNEIISRTISNRNTHIPPPIDVYYNNN